MPGPDSSVPITPGSGTNVATNTVTTSTGVAAQMEVVNFADPVTGTGASVNPDGSQNVAIISIQLGVITTLLQQVVNELVRLQYVTVDGLNVKGFELAELPPVSLTDPDFV